MSKALVIDGAPVEIGSGQGFTDAEGIQHPGNILDLWEEADLNAIGVYTVVEATTPPAGKRFVSSSLVFADGVVTRQGVFEPIPAPTHAELEEYAVGLRWAVMNSGILFDGNPIPTDEIGRGLVAGAWNRAKDDPNVTKSWQVANSPVVFVTFSNAQLVALGNAVEHFIQSCFDKLKDVAESISNGTITNHSQIDTAFSSINRVFTS